MYSFEWWIKNQFAFFEYTLFNLGNRDGLPILSKTVGVSPALNLA